LDRQDKGFSPLSVGSGEPYKGINCLGLWAQAQNKGYSSALWGTFKSWLDLGASVRKGERGSLVVYWGTIDRHRAEESEETNGASRPRLFAKSSIVFNADQVDGLKMPKRFEPKLSHNERIARADRFFTPLAVVRDGGNRAYYRPDTPEAVYMPGFDQFPEAEQQICRSLYRDGLNYTVQFNLADARPHVLIAASGAAKGRKQSAGRRLTLLPAVPAQRCRERALEAAWFLPENRERRNANTTHWRGRAGRYTELNGIAEEYLRADLEYWRELELLSGQREHFKPGRSDETAYLDDEPEVMAA
jgi:hypothetical protein